MALSTADGGEGLATYRALNESALTALSVGIQARPSEQGEAFAEHFPDFCLIFVSSRLDGAPHWQTRTLGAEIYYSINVVEVTDYVKSGGSVYVIPLRALSSFLERASSLRRTSGLTSDASTLFKHLRSFAFLVSYCIA